MMMMSSTTVFINQARLGHIGWQTEVGAGGGAFFLLHYAGKETPIAATYTLYSAILLAGQLFLRRAVPSLLFHAASGLLGGFFSFFHEVQTYSSYIPA